MHNKIVIDGVKYVPATEVSLDVKKLMRAMAAEWWGWDAEEIDDPETYRNLYVQVGEDHDSTTPTLEDFAESIAKHLTGPLS